MRAILEMAANERENDYVSVLCRELQAHVEVVFEKFVVETTFEINNNKYTICML